jgi:hypothetical protein
MAPPRPPARPWFTTGLVVVGVVLVGPGQPAPGLDAAPPAPSSAADLAGAAVGVVETPTRLEIPAIDVDAPIEPLELNPDGTLEVPDDAEVTGWFTGGPEPGEAGNAIIAGHLDSFTGPGVFARLRDLERGERIIIHGADGTTLTFAVEGAGQYAKTDFPTEEVYGPSTLPGLRLITCGGGFDHATGHYEDNLVVYAWPSP